MAVKDGAQMNTEDQSFVATSLLSSVVELATAAQESTVPTTAPTPAEKTNTYHSEAVGTADTAKPAETFVTVEASGTAVESKPADEVATSEEGETDGAAVPAGIAGGLNEAESTAEATNLTENVSTNGTVDTVKAASHEMTAVVLTAVTPSNAALPSTDCVALSMLSTGANLLVATSATDSATAKPAKTVQQPAVLATNAAVTTAQPTLITLPEPKQTFFGLYKPPAVISPRPAVITPPKTAVTAYKPAAMASHLPARTPKVLPTLMTALSPRGTTLVQKPTSATAVAQKPTVALVQNKPVTIMQPRRGLPANAQAPVAVAQNPGGVVQTPVEAAQNPVTKYQQCQAPAVERQQVVYNAAITSGSGGPKLVSLLAPSQQLTPMGTLTPASVKTSHSATLQIMSDGNLRVVKNNPSGDSANFPARDTTLSSSPQQLFFMKRGSDGETQLLMASATEPNKFFLLQPLGGKKFQIKQPESTSGDVAQANLGRTVVRPSFACATSQQRFTPPTPVASSVSFSDPRRVCVVPANGTAEGRRKRVRKRARRTITESKEVVVDASSSSTVPTADTDDDNDPDNLLPVFFAKSKSPKKRKKKSTKANAQPELELQSYSEMPILETLGDILREEGRDNVFTAEGISDTLFPRENRVSENAPSCERDNVDDEVDFPFRIDSVFSLSSEEPAFDSPVLKEPDAKEEPEVIKEEDMDLLLSQEELLEKCGSSFVVLERLSKKDIDEKGHVLLQSRCTDYCRKRTLNYMCMLDLIVCPKKRRVKIEEDDEDFKNSPVSPNGPSTLSSGGHTGAKGVKQEEVKSGREEEKHDTEIDVDKKSESVRADTSVVKTEGSTKNDSKSAPGRKGKGSRKRSRSRTLSPAPIPQVPAKAEPETLPLKSTWRPTPNNLLSLRSVFTEAVEKPQHERRSSRSTGSVFVAGSESAEIHVQNTAESSTNREMVPRSSPVDSTPEKNVVSKGNIQASRSDIPSAVFHDPDFVDSEPNMAASDYPGDTLHTSGHTETSDSRSADVGDHQSAVDSQTSNIQGDHQYASENTKAADSTTERLDEKEPYSLPTEIAGFTVISPFCDVETNPLDLESSPVSEERTPQDDTAISQSSESVARVTKDSASEKVSFSDTSVSEKETLSLAQPKATFQDISSLSKPVVSSSEDGANIYKNIVLAKNFRTVIKPPDSDTDRAKARPAGCAKPKMVKISSKMGPYKPSSDPIATSSIVPVHKPGSKMQFFLQKVSDSSGSKMVLTPVTDVSGSIGTRAGPVTASAKTSVTGTQDTVVTYKVQNAPSQKQPSALTVLKAALDAPILTSVASSEMTPGVTVAPKPVPETVPKFISVTVPKRPPVAVPSGTSAFAGLSVAAATDRPTKADSQSLSAKTNQPVTLVPAAFPRSVGKGSSQNKIIFAGTCAPAAQVSTPVSFVMTSLPSASLSVPSAGGGTQLPVAVLVSNSVSCSKTGARSLLPIISTPASGATTTVSTGNKGGRVVRSVPPTSASLPSSGHPLLPTVLSVSSTAKTSLPIFVSGSVLSEDASSAGIISASSFAPTLSASHTVAVQPKPKVVSSSGCMVSLLNKTPVSCKATSLLLPTSTTSVHSATAKSVSGTTPVSSGMNPTASVANPLILKTSTAPTDSQQVAQSTKLVKVRFPNGETVCLPLAMNTDSSTGQSLVAVPPGTPAQNTANTAPGAVRLVPSKTPASLLKKTRAGGVRTTSISTTAPQSGRGGMTVTRSRALRVVSEEGTVSAVAVTASGLTALPTLTQLVSQPVSKLEQQTQKVSKDAGKLSDSAKAESLSLPASFESKAADHTEKDPQASGKLSDSSIENNTQAEGDSNKKKRKKKYSLPPGVVIKTEPVSHGFSNDEDTLPKEDGSTPLSLAPLTEENLPPTSSPSANGNTEGNNESVSDNVSKNIAPEEARRASPDLEATPELEPACDTSAEADNRPSYDEPPVLTPEYSIPETKRKRASRSKAKELSFEKTSHSSDIDISPPKLTRSTRRSTRAIAESVSSLEKKSTASSDQSSTSQVVTKPSASSSSSKSAASMSSAPVASSSTSHPEASSSTRAPFTPSSSSSLSASSSASSERIRQLKAMLQQQNEQLEQIRKQRAMRGPLVIGD